MWGFLAALISGALMSIQGVFNTEVTKQSSLWVSTGWVQLSAFAVCAAAWFFTGRQSVSALWQVENKYTLLGGVIGAFITITVIQSMGALGPAKAAMLIVISQLIVAYRYLAYDFDQPFLSQYRDNMLFLKAMLEKLA